MSTTKAGPLQNRIAALDILRGFALLGVLTVNMGDFSSGAYFPDYTFPDWGPANQLAYLAVHFLAEYKFYLLFSFLFGLGFAVQMGRMEGRGGDFVPFYLRRLAILMLIGLLHAFLLWRGDILRLYALLGLVLLLVRGVQSWKLYAGALALMGLSLLIFASAGSETDWPSSWRIYLDYSYWQLVEYRATTPIETLWLGIQLPSVLAMFFLGLSLGRSGVMEKPEVYQPFLRRWLAPALILGLIGNGVYVLALVSEAYPLAALAVHIGAPALSFAYASLILLNAHRLSFLAPVGQMALTNYLSHSLICTTLFYGYGLGLYNQVDPLGRWALIAAIYGGQILLSNFWMARFRFGPMEWLWRSLTYGRAQPWRRGAA
jgi:uncharacterized protein